MSKKIVIVPLLVFLMTLTSLGIKNPKREMRAVWVATVANIDWPSSPALSVEKQQTEFIQLLDLCKAYHMNTVIFQIRPAADAFYASRFEPWSQYLTGKQGKQPEPFYDPLAFASRECRKRGIDLHVWLNPYRAVSDVSNNRTSPDHLSNTHPEWFLTYGKTKYFNPALPETRNFVSQVVSDIVRRYDIDAIHMDDYFYPYRIAGEEFPDQSTFKMYQGNYADNQKDEWRRNNVDLIIKQLHDTIKSIKPWVEFGISPFGVWRNNSKDPKGSATKAGQTNYDDLYADVLKWQKAGWIDYVTPQIYWEIGKDVADYAIIAKWWNQNAYGTQLYVGQAPYRIDPQAKEQAWQSADEIIRQINLNRSLKNVSGSMYFSAKFMKSNPLGLKEKLLSGYYASPALPPVNPRVKSVESEIPGNPTISVENNRVHLQWNKGVNTKYFVVYQVSKWRWMKIKNPGNILISTSDNSVTYPLTVQTDPRRNKYVITSISYSNSESKPARFKYQKN